MGRRETDTEDNEMLTLYVGKDNWLETMLSPPSRRELGGNLTQTTITFGIIIIHVQYILV